MWEAATRRWPGGGFGGGRGVGSRGIGGDGERGGAEAWAALLVEAPEMGALDLCSRVLGQRLGELSMAQITAVQVVQRDVALRLEDARVELARRLERRR